MAYKAQKRPALSSEEPQAVQGPPPRVLVLSTSSAPPSETYSYLSVQPACRSLSLSLSLSLSSRVDVHCESANSPETRAVIEF